MKPKAHQDDFRDFVLDQLDALPGVTSRRMFGGFGLYQDATFFGIIASGTLYFKTNAQTQQRYQQAGSGPFRPNAKQTLKHYFNVPVEILEDTDALCDWAREAIDAATASI